jgi:hypothetical protein
MTDEHLCALDAMLQAEMERRALLKRCLGLEKECIRLRWLLYRAGITARRVVTAEDVAQMRGLVERGMTRRAAGKVLGWSQAVVARYTKGLNANTRRAVKPAAR